MKVDLKEIMENGTVGTMRKISSVLNKYFYFLLPLMMMVGFVANYHGRAMSGILHYYIDFARLIRSGFKIRIEYPTFPMWGYGFLFAAINNKILILLLQFSISLFTICMLDKLVLQIFNTNIAKTLFRFFLLFSFPWFSFNSLLWPYSIAANFTILALIFLYKYFNSNKNRYLVLSACLFGIVLNFRSDYYLYPLFLVFLLVGYKLYLWKNKLPTKFKMRHICLWLTLIYVFLVPYAIFAKVSTGHYLITSTNSGHVLFIGLGLLPNNKWGITPKDEDSKMAEIMKEELGQENYGYNLQYEGDKVLKKYFLNMIKKDPVEYIKKILYSGYLMLKGGFYSGEYENWTVPAKGAAKIHLDIRESLKKLNFKNTFQIFQKEGAFFTLLYVLLRFSRYYGKFLFLFFNLSLFLFLYKKFYQLDYFLSIIFLSIIFYQYVSCLFAYYMACYITNLYLIYFFSIFWTIDCYVERKRGKPSVSSSN